jgi:pantoate--beta-alanine ligase
MRALSDAARRAGQRITLFPTMGFLHAGHLSLIRRARRDGDVVVVSLFVNPTQFGPKEDFASYQRDFDRDRELINDCGGDVLFAPTIYGMYPERFSAFVDVDGLAETLCGASRLGNFKGVATIVTKLFTSVRPPAAVFGQKDAQQALLIKRLTRDLNLGVEILVSPTVRESDGLARSSRNAYLTEEERSVAPVLFYALQAGRRLILDGVLERNWVLDWMRKMVEGRPGLEIDYVEAVDTDSLVVRSRLEGRPCWLSQ